MAGMTLAQSANLTQDILQKGVIEVMVKESKILQMLPFMNVVGSGYAYNLLGDYGTAEFRAVNAGMQNIETFSTVQQVAVITRMINEAVIDNYIAQVESNVNDIIAIEVALKAKNMAYTYEKTFISGDGTNNSFKGIKTLVNEYKTLTGIGDSGTGVDQTFEATGDLEDDLDVLLDMVKGGAEAIILNKKMRRALTKVSRGRIRTTPIEAVGQNGLQIEAYGDVALLVVDDSLLEDECVIALRFGAREAVCGLQNGSIVVKDLGELESLPQQKTRIEWYCGLAVFDPKTVAIRLPKADV